MTRIDRVIRDFTPYQLDRSQITLTTIRSIVEPRPFSLLTRLLKLWYKHELTLTGQVFIDRYLSKLRLRHDCFWEDTVMLDRQRRLPLRRTRQLKNNRPASIKTW